jgi:hypothetical protein
MGPELYLRVLEDGANVVLAGRSSDAALFAALGLRHGMPAGPSWHAGKVLECGAAPAVQRLYPDCCLATIDHDGFTVEIPNPAMRCSALSVRAHGYYENADPYRIGEPGGTIDTSQCVYSEVADGAVRVTGSRFIPADRYEVRVEGCRFAGYRSIAIAGISDSVLLRHFTEFHDTWRDRVIEKVDTSLGMTIDKQYRLIMRVYGRPDATGTDRLETERVGVLIEAVAETQATAHAIVAIAVHTGMHHPVTGWEGFVSNLAVPFSPAVLDGGAVYEWSVNHLVTLENAWEPFRVTGPRRVSRESADAAW